MIAFVDARGGISGTSLLAAAIAAGAGPDDVADLLGPFLAGSKLLAEDVVVDGLGGRRVAIEDPAARVIDGPPDVIRALATSGLPHDVRDRATDVYRRLATAEARVHGVEPDAVRFEELASRRSVVGVIGSIAALREIGITTVVASPLPFGGGTVETHHGRLPLPAPATRELLRGIPVEPQVVPGELVTPTGAALIAVLASRFGDVPAATARTIGIGSAETAATPIVTRLVLASA